MPYFYYTPFFLGHAAAIFGGYLPGTYHWTCFPNYDNYDKDEQFYFFTSLILLPISCYYFILDMGFVVIFLLLTIIAYSIKWTGIATRYVSNKIKQFRNLFSRKQNKNE